MPGNGARKPGGAEVAKCFSDSVLTPKFFEEHWEKRPLHWRSAERGQCANGLPEAFSVDDLVSLVRIAGPNLKMFRHSEAAKTDNFMLAYLEGASLVVNQADR